MKAILEFNLPDDQSEFDDATSGWKWKHMVWEFDQYLRSQIKYNGDAYTQEQYDQLVKIREKLYEHINNDNLILDI